MWGFGGALRALGNDMGFVKLVMGASVALYLAALALDPSGIRSGGMSLYAPSVPAMFLLGASGGMPAFEYGRWWTFLSAGWLHWGVIHIGFNMMWVRTLGTPTAELYGAGRMIIIYTVSGIVGFLFSSVAYWYAPFIPGIGFLLQILRLGGGQITAGASAPIFGLLGALLYYGRRAGSGAVSREMVSYAVFLGIMGFIIPRCGQPSPSWRVRGRLRGGEIPRPSRARAGRPPAHRRHLPRAHRRRHRRVVCDRSQVLPDLSPYSQRFRPWWAPLPLEPRSINTAMTTTTR